MTPTGPDDRPWHRGLTPDAIAEAALGIGFDRLTIAALADELEVTQAALYRHFPSRDAIVDAALDLLARRIDWPAAEDDWRQHLRHIGETLVATFSTHPGLAREVHRLGAPPMIVAQINTSAVVLINAGFSEADAMLALTMLNSLVDGVADSATVDAPSVLQDVEQNRRRPVPFSAQLDTLIAGLATRLADEPS
ncbi:MAG: TetR/AcrR family transcriptional regulator [Actinomycetota bacterium]